MCDKNGLTSPSYPPQQLGQTQQHCKNCLVETTKNMLLITSIYFVSNTNSVLVGLDRGRGSWGYLILNYLSTVSSRWGRPVLAIPFPSATKPKRLESDLELSFSSLNSSLQAFALQRPRVGYNVAEPHSSRTPGRKRGNLSITMFLEHRLCVV